MYIERGPSVTELGLWASNHCWQGNNLETIFNYNYNIFDSTVIYLMTIYFKLV